MVKNPLFLFKKLNLFLAGNLAFDNVPIPQLLQLRGRNADRPFQSLFQDFRLLPVFPDIGGIVKRIHAFPCLIDRIQRFVERHKILSHLVVPLEGDTGRLLHFRIFQKRIELFGQSPEIHRSRKRFQIGQTIRKLEIDKIFLHGVRDTRQAGRRQRGQTDIPQHQSPDLFLYGSRRLFRFLHRRTRGCLSR